MGAASTIFSLDKTSEKCPLRFEINAEYSFNNKSYSELSIIDLRPFLHTTVPFDAISDEIRQLRISIEKLIKSK